jgi:hypothetical protein
MGSTAWFDRIRALDVRLFAAVAAALMLIVGVMWVVPTTPNSNSFTFDAARRDISDARPIELASTVQGTLVDGSDVDFYRKTYPRPPDNRCDEKHGSGQE